jgi:hypothetical protein
MLLALRAWRCEGLISGFVQGADVDQQAHCACHQHIRQEIYGSLSPCPYQVWIVRAVLGRIGSAVAHPQTPRRRRTANGGPSAGSFPQCAPVLPMAEWQCGGIECHSAERTNATREPWFPRRRYSFAGPGAGRPRRRPVALVAAGRQPASTPRWRPSLLLPGVWLHRCHLHKRTSSGPPGSPRLDKAPGRVWPCVRRRYLGGLLRPRHGLLEGVELGLALDRER